MNRQQARRNARVEQHMRLVEPLARRYARSSGQDPEDLRQVGLLGLLRAAERYEGSRDVPFAAYARPHVRGAILHYLRDRAAIIRLPRRVQDQASDTGTGFNVCRNCGGLFNLRRHRSPLMVSAVNNWLKRNNGI